MSGDRITLTGVRGFGYHGVYAEEKRAGQEFVVDVTMSLDLRAAAASDFLGQRSIKNAIPDSRQRNDRASMFA